MGEQESVTGRTDTRDNLCMTLQEVHICWCLH